MRRPVPTWLAVLLIAIMIVGVVVIFALSGQRRGEEMPKGFKPSPPMFKEAPIQK